MSLSTLREILSISKDDTIMLAKKKRKAEQSDINDALMLVNKKRKAECQPDTNDDIDIYSMSIVQDCISLQAATKKAYDDKNAVVECLSKCRILLNQSLLSSKQAERCKARFLIIRTTSSKIESTQIAGILQSLSSHISVSSEDLDIAGILQSLSTQHTTDTKDSVEDDDIIYTGRQACDNDVIIRESTVPNAGDGVFYTTNVYAGLSDIRYGGKTPSTLADEEVNNEQSDLEYILSFERDGKCEHVRSSGHWTGIINHAWGARANVHFNHEGFLVFEHDIKASAAKPVELLFDYGYGYWCNKLLDKDIEDYTPSVQRLVENLLVNLIL
jgi:hypothetical protein